MQKPACFQGDETKCALSRWCPCAGTRREAACIPVGLLRHRNLGLGVLFVLEMSPPWPDTVLQGAPSLEAAGKGTKGLQRCSHRYPEVLTSRPHGTRGYFRPPAARWWPWPGSPQASCSRRLRPFPGSAAAAVTASAPLCLLLPQPAGSRMWPGTPRGTGSHPLLLSSSLLARLTKSKQRANLSRGCRHLPGAPVSAHTDSALPAEPLPDQGTRVPAGAGHCPAAGAASPTCAWMVAFHPGQVQPCKKMFT